MRFDWLTIRGRGCQDRRGFTLIEVMVSVIILAILAGMVVVRLQSDIRRRRDIKGIKVLAVLDTLAFRQQMSQDRIALAWDGDSKTLRLERLYAESVEERPTWQRDLMADPVTFGDADIQLTSLRFDGELVNLMGEVHWEMPMAATRPSIELEMAWGENVDLMQLWPHELKAMRYGMGLEEVWEDGLEPIDLDAEGQAEEEW